NAEVPPLWPVKGLHPILQSSGTRTAKTAPRRVPGKNSRQTSRWGDWNPLRRVIRQGIGRPLRSCPPRPVPPGPGRLGSQLASKPAIPAIQTPGQQNGAPAANDAPGVDQVDGSPWKVSLEKPFGASLFFFNRDCQFDLRE